jgi:hypothetical protein
VLDAPWLRCKCATSTSVKLTTSSTHTTAKLRTSPRLPNWTLGLSCSDRVLQKSTPVTWKKIT